MPSAGLRPCTHGGCPRLCKGTSRCPQHKHRPRSNWSRSSAQSRGYGHDWRKVREQVLARDGGQCQSCGAAASHVDHVVPKHMGGTDEPGNLQALCSGCHAFKTAAESARARTA